MNQNLTERETEVLYYVAKGLSNKAIGEVLNITHHTVKAHLSSALYKLKCKNRTEIAIHAERNNLFNHLLSSTQP